MSLDSWKKEFYSVPASRVAKKDALAHSLRKWQGLLPAAMHRHGIERTGGGYWLREKRNVRKRFGVGGSACALCFLSHDLCGGCILVQIVEKGCGPAYGRWLENADPSPMIALLRKAMRAQAKKGKA